MFRLHNIHKYIKTVFLGFFQFLCGFQIREEIKAYFDLRLRLDLLTNRTFGF
jgi:hypothetical protein